MREQKLTVKQLQDLVEGIETAITATILAGDLELIGLIATSQWAGVRALPNEIHMDLDAHKFTAALWGADELALLTSKWIVDNQEVGKKARTLADEIQFVREN